jgi:hypothetical protein
MGQHCSNRFCACCFDRLLTPFCESCFDVEARRPPIPNIPSFPEHMHPDEFGFCQSCHEFKRHAEFRQLSIQKGIDPQTVENTSNTSPRGAAASVVAFEAKTENHLISTLAQAALHGGGATGVCKECERAVDACAAAVLRAKIDDRPDTTAFCRMLLETVLFRRLDWALNCVEELQSDRRQRTRPRFLFPPENAIGASSSFEGQVVGSRRSSGMVAVKAAVRMTIKGKKNEVHSPGSRRTGTPRRGLPTNVTPSNLKMPDAGTLIYQSIVTIRGTELCIKGKDVN